jgi:DNA-binding Lrp family transcriptional regulator
MNELLEILQENDRLSPAQIATMLDISEEEVIKQIKELEEKKIIIKYGATINWEKTSKDLVYALIDVKVAPQRGVGFDAVAERIYPFPEVQSVYLMSGGYDLSVQVVGKSMKDVALFVAEKLATIDFVQSTTTHFVLKKYKEDGVIFESQEKNERLKITL